MNYNGSMTALITPFKNGKIDGQSYAKLIQRQINNGINTVVPVGTTGESATLNHNEHKECIEIAVAICKGTKTTVLAGAGSNATHEAIDLAKFAQEAGADSILCVAPYYNKPTQEGLYQHFKAINDNCSIPIIIYNIPPRSVVDMSVDTMARLFELKNIVGVKDATGVLDRVSQQKKKWELTLSNLLVRMGMCLNLTNEVV